MRFACFALGNKQYEHFCYMGRWAHKALLGLGATAVHELGEGDDDDDLMADFEKWREGLWEVRRGECGWSSALARRCEQGGVQASSWEARCRLLRRGAPPRHVTRHIVVTVPRRRRLAGPRRRR